MALSKNEQSVLFTQRIAFVFKCWLSYCLDVVKAAVQETPGIEKTVVTHRFHKREHRHHQGPQRSTGQCMSRGSEGRQAGPFIAASTEKNKSDSGETDGSPA